MEKVIKDGKVAVLVSNDWGWVSGFYTSGAPLEAIFNPQLVELIDNQKYDEAKDFVRKTYPNTSIFSVTDLYVEWVEEGREFYITEYGGIESIVFKDEVKWITA
jgi:deoxyribodipyrimidine photolyase